MSKNKRMTASPLITDRMDKVESQIDKILDDFHQLRMLVVKEPKVKTTVTVKKIQAESNKAPKQEPVTTVVTVWREEFPKGKSYSKWIWIPGNRFYKVIYYFEGTPNIDQIIDKLPKPGALAVKVLCTEDFPFLSISCKYAYIWNNILGYIRGEWGWRYEGYLATRDRNPNITDADIEFTITRFIEKQKPKPVYHAIGSRLRWNGKAPHLPDQPEQEVYVSRILKGIYPYEITPQNAGICAVTADSLSPLPEPIVKAFEVGDIVASVYNGKTECIGKIVPSYKNCFCIESKDGKEHYTLLEKVRHATPVEIDEFYTGEIAGKRVRAYETECKNVVLVLLDSEVVWLLPDHPDQARAICETSHIPIMSFEKSKGEFRAPKGGNK